MSSNKTEKPTKKKLKDASQKGQSFKSKDLITTCLILIGCEFIAHTSLPDVIIGEIRKIIFSGFTMSPKAYALAVIFSGLKLLLPFILLCIFASALPTLLQTGFMIASKALKLNFASLNPVKGVKKLFSLRAAKDAIKSCLYLCSFAVAGKIFWDRNKTLLMAQLHATPQQITVLWGELLHSLVVICLGCLVAIMALDMVAEFFLHIKDLKMDKQEVKREHKEQEGNPEVKHKRRELHQELLSEQVKSDIEKSRVIIANPTHIAVGIYQNPAISFIPFISVLETNQRALAVRAWAEKCGVPVIEDVRLARKIFRTHQRYSFIKLEELDPVLRLLFWLEEVENAWSREVPYEEGESERFAEVSRTHND